MFDPSVVQEGAPEAPKVALTFDQLPSRAERDAKNRTLIAEGKLPSDELVKEDVFEWYKLTETLNKAKAAEMLMRIKIFKTMFVNPKEGTNKTPLPDGWQINAQRVVTRDVDEGVLEAMSAKMLGKNDVPCPSVFEQNGINVNKVFKWKPSLAKSEYNTLTTEQQKVVDRALIIKDGSPQMKIELPAKNDPNKQRK